MSAGRCPTTDHVQARARVRPFPAVDATVLVARDEALVLGDIASLRETWDEAAIFVPPDDSTALENALNSLIENSPRREYFGRRARARALEFSPHRMATEYMAAYRVCAGRQSCLPAENPQRFVEEVAA